MNGGTLSIDQSGNSTYAGVFGGTGALTKAGAGNLTLSGLHSATGIYNINAGTLTLAPTGSGGFTFAGSGININNGSKLATTSRPEFFWGKTITFDANGGGTINFGTNVGAFPLTIRTLGGLKNTVTGAGLFNLSTDRLVFDIAQATGGGSALEVSNGTVNSNAASQIVKSGTGTLTFTGTFGSTTPFALNAGTVEVGANGTTGSIASSTISIASGAILKFNRSNAITASNTISGAGSLWQAGSGTLSLSGTNTYTGGTSINGGTLALASSGAIGSSGTISFGGGTLQYSTSNSTDYSNRFSNAANQAYSIDTNGQTVTLASALSSSGGSLAKSGNGTLILTGADTYSGGTTISGGTLQVGAGGTTGALGTGGVLNNAALIFNRSDNVTDANAISGTGSVQKSGSGTLTLSGANTYTGATTISAGTLFLDLGSATSLGRSSSYTGTGTLTLQSSGAVSQGTPILSVSNLLLKGTGSFTLDNVNNAVGVIAAGNDDGSAIGGLSFVNASALGIGTVGLSGIKAGGAVDISTLTGDLTVAQNVTGSSITLNAGKNAAAGTSTGGNILLTGTPTLTASTGRTLLYTGSVAGSSGITTLVGSGSGNFRYNSDEASSGFDTATKPLGATGTFAIYREQPTLTVTANNTTKTYDGLAFSGGNGITLSDYVNGDSGALPSDAVLYGGTSQGARNAGSYQITLGGVSSDPHGYGITYENGTLTINQRPITITADAKSKVYGNTDPSLTYQVTIGNLVTDDSLTVALTRAAGENIGSYTINASALANGNYLITTNNGALSISQRPITVTADSLSKVYGNSDPTLTYQVTSGTMVGGDSLTVALTRAAGENVGSYTIDASALANGNYLITANNGALSITQRPITVTADNLNKIYGNSDPALTYQVTSGTMVSGDTLTGALTRSAGENVGSYTIDVGTLVNGNYLITANNGALSITQRPITVTADNLNKIYGNSDPALTYQVTTGTMVSGDTLSGALTRSAGENVGSYTINASALANGNYLITANNGSLSISQRPTAITTISATTPPINASIFPPPNRQLTTINPAVTLADLSTLPSSLLLSQTNTENLGDIKRLTLIRNAAGQLLLTELSTTRAGIYTPSLGATAGSSDIERRQ
jgi:autotransporter-associated beta strand protein